MGLEEKPLNEFLELVENRLADVLEPDTALMSSDTGLLLKAARHLCLGDGAKRARPRLVHAFGSALGAEPADLVDIAVAAELIHAASLMHDDVVDEGTIRRGRPTANTVWGNTVAVLSGDLLLSIAFEQVKKLPFDILSDALDTVNEMTRAAIMEVCQRGKPDIPLSRWRKVAEGKTGALFAWCGKATGHLVCDSGVTKMFDSCGRHLGVAFQLVDDLKDILPAETGKDRLADIRSRNPSYPLLVASGIDPEIRESLASLWETEKMVEERVGQIEKMVLSTEAVEITRKAVAEEIDSAVRALDRFSDSLGGRRVKAWAMGLAAAVDACESMNVMDLIEENDAINAENYSLTGLET